MRVRGLCSTLLNRWVCLDSSLRRTAVTLLSVPAQQCRSTNYGGDRCLFYTLSCTRTHNTSLVVRLTFLSSSSHLLRHLVQLLYGKKKHSNQVHRDRTTNSDHVILNSFSLRMRIELLRNSKSPASSDSRKDGVSLRWETQKRPKCSSGEEHTSGSEVQVRVTR